MLLAEPFFFFALYPAQRGLFSADAPLRRLINAQ